MPKKKGKKIRYVSAAKMPEELDNCVAATVANHPELGYVTPPEFYRDAVRHRIEEVNNNTKKGIHHK